MGYSRDIERENRALQHILDGGTPDKRVLVANEDLDFKKSLQKEKEKDRERINKKFEATKEARMPWFCPSCTKVMKRRLDDKTWLMYSHCFNCQLQVEHKMRIEGTYDAWMDKKVLANKLAWIKDQKVLIQEFKEQDTPEFYQQFRPDGYSIDKEKWNMDKDSFIQQADDALEFLEKMEDSLK
tara:strand:+ start:194 stop:742 length:549 start_codon:yes stop_codon:yes gene_type:complete